MIKTFKENLNNTPKIEDINFQNLDNYWTDIDSEEYESEADEKVEKFVMKILFKNQQRN